MKIIDGFIFSNEMDMLRLRLETLRQDVDYHILVEGNETFAGRAKTLNYRMARDEFGLYSEFRSKIIWVPVLHAFGNRWEREKFHRNAILQGLKDIPALNPDDILVISDVDEIPKPSFFNAARERDRVAAQMITYYYDVNHLSRQSLTGPCSMRVGSLTYPQDLRDHRHDHFQVPVGAWHFSFFKPHAGLSLIEGFQEKVHSFAHSEFDTPEWTNTERVTRTIQRGDDPFNRSEFPLEYVDVSHDLPDYLLNNRERFSQWFATTAE